jgi:biopolymer transport protein ExbB
MQPPRKIWTRRKSGLRLLPVLLLAGLCQIVLARPALAWWNGDWQYRVKVDADTTAKGANVNEPIGHMQVLLRLHSGNFNFATAKQDGSDLRVVAADDRTPLHFQIEKFDGLVDQVGLIWVDVPAVGPNAVTSFYVYWGSKNATNGSDAKGTFGGDQLLVYHFDEDSGPARDATAYGNNATTAAKRVDGGMIGDGVHLDGKSAIHLPQSPSLAIPAGQPMTWSLWVHPDDNVASGVLYDDKDGANEFIIGIDNRVPYAQITTAAGTVRTPAGPPIAATGWHLISVTAGAKLDVYADGQKLAEIAATLPALNGLALLGGTADAPLAAVPAPAPAPVPASPAAAPAPATPPAPDATATPPPPAAPAGPPNFIGTIDEFRITKAVVPVGVDLVRVAAEGPSPKLLTLAPPEQASAFGSGYLGIILRSVTPDAWVVISILGVMSAISWIVMIGKAIYVSRVNSANAAFRSAYRERVSNAHGDLLTVMRGMRDESATNGKWRGSTLFRINDVASTEIDDRLTAGRVDADGTMAARSIAAIRSSLDARMAVEIQHLNRMMVLLTIAIAGGPFIGLLGTVIGVMITFAAIAQAGDVNVNAIAPGISAALLATVAGLAVAIPALFGYNYFNTRITDVISDMQVHIDMLVTRMGEGLLGKRPQAGE